MAIAHAARALGGGLVTGAAGAARTVEGGYVSDLLSDVMAHAAEGDVWIPLQRHPNIVAIAHLKALAGIVLVNGREPESDTLARAIEESIPIVTTSLPAFEAAGTLHALGVRGRGCTDGVRS